METKKSDLLRKTLGGLTVICAITMMLFNHFVKGDGFSGIPVILLCCGVIILAGKATNNYKPVDIRSKTGKVLLGIVVTFLLSGIVTFFIIQF